MYNEVKRKHWLSKMNPETFVIDLNSMSSEETRIWIDLENEYREEAAKIYKREMQKNKSGNGYDNVAFAGKRLKRMGM